MYSRAGGVRARARLARARRWLEFQNEQLELYDELFKHEVPVIEVLQAP